MNKASMYSRIQIQLTDLFKKTESPLSRMATVCAVLHHKMQPYYFWTGYYLLDKGELLVGPYQGSVACLVLAKDKGVCWASVNSKHAIIVPDVHKFDGHIACDSRSKSEIVVPLFDKQNNVIGVLDVDSDKLNSFDEIDRDFLERINELIYT